jgi:hypothetical protein
MPGQESRSQIQWPRPFFRAYFYFGMVKRFGDVPWYSTTIELDGPGVAYQSTRPAHARDGFGNGRYRLRHRQPRRQPPGDHHYQVHCIGAEIRMALFEGTFRKYHPEYNLPDADKFLDACISASEDLMKNSGYSDLQGHAGYCVYEAVFVRQCDSR